MNEKIKKVLTKRVSEHWDEYKVILPADAGEVQVKETKQAFYAGMLVMFQFQECLAYLDEDSKEDETIVLDMLDTHKAELNLFMLEAGFKSGK